MKKLIFILLLSASAFSQQKQIHTTTAECHDFIGVSIKTNLSGLSFAEMNSGRQILGYCVAEYGDSGLTNKDLMGAFLALQLMDNEISKRMAKEVSETEKSLNDAEKECQTKIAIAASRNSITTVAGNSCSPTIESRIQGDYKGWDGSKVYELQNGQIWKQSIYHYHYHYAYSPEIKIFYTESGCLMKVDDDDDDGAIVTRIR